MIVGLFGIFLVRVIILNYYYFIKKYLAIDFIFVISCGILEGWEELWLMFLLCGIGL